jgi:hypothetical protein
MDGSPPVRLGPGSARALSPDGKWVAVFTLKSPVHATLLPTGTGEARDLPAGSLAQFHFAEFTSNGKQLLLLANEAGRDMRLWIQDLAGGDPRPLTAEGRVGVPDHDGANIAVYTTQGWELQATVPGAPVRKLSETLATDDMLRFTRDGRFLIGRTRDEQPARLFRIDVATGKRLPWKELGPSADVTGRVGAVDITDDGSVYVYNHTDLLRTLYVATGVK